MSPNKTSFSSVLRGLRLAAFMSAAGVGTLFADNKLVAESPFAPAGAATIAGNAPPEAYELAGSSTQGAAVAVCVFERQKKHSQWIPVGGDVDGIHVISFDASHDTAIVTISGTRKELSMRKAVIASANTSPPSRMPVAVGGPMEPPMPIAAAPLPTAPSAAQDQKEARMLVSDLLEIGVQQRKAYQDAKMKAAQGPPPSPGN
jgi:hypothetical protein